VSYEATKIDVAYDAAGTLSDGDVFLTNENRVSFSSPGETNIEGDGILFNLIVTLKAGVEIGAVIPISIEKGDSAGVINEAGVVSGIVFVAGGVHAVDNKTPLAGDYSFTPASSVYNGNAQGVTVTKVTAAAGDVTKVYYTGTAGTTYIKSETPPTSAGSYTISIDAAANPDAHYLAAENLVLGVYTIAKATLTIDWPTASAVIKGDALSTSTLTGGSTTYGSFAWADGTFVPTATGTQAFDVVFTPNAATLANYDLDETVLGSVSVLVYLLYDVDGDGELTIFDVQLVRQHLVNKITLTPAQFALADVDGDGYITLADASNLQRILIGLDPIL
jgi:hypothetical protein